MALSDFPYKINNTALPFPSSWTVNPDVLETKKTSEGGTDMIQIQRRNKRTISVSYKLAGVDWLKKILEWKDEDALTVQQYNPITNTYETMTMRMRGVSYGKVKNSEELTAVTGVWTVSFKLEEY